MMVSLLHFGVFRKDPCTVEMADLFTTELVVALIVTVLADVEMLAIGVVYELPNTKGWAKRWARWLDDLVGGRQYSGLLLGFAALVVTFAPSGIVAIESKDAEALGLFVLTLVAWMTYGLVALAFPGTQNAMVRSACYSVLDVFSKNVVGIVYAVLALAWDQGDECAAVR